MLKYPSPKREIPTRQVDGWVHKAGKQGRKKEKREERREKKKKNKQTNKKTWMFLPLF